MPSPEYTSPDSRHGFIVPDAIHLTGPGLAELNPDRYEILERLFGDFGLQAVMVVNRGEIVEIVNDRSKVAFPEGDPPPVPMDRKGFFAFAKRHGFTSGLARDTWDRTREVYEQDCEGRFWDCEPYSHIQVEGPLDEYRNLVWGAASFDIRSIRERFVALPDPRYWQREGRRKGTRPLAFLRDLVNIRFPEEQPIETMY